MVQGFNHNVRIGDTVYHVQTEDSGRENPHIVTHVFVGGTIIASQRSSYADRLGEGRLEETVRALMQEQHKAVLRNLKNGHYAASSAPPAASRAAAAAAPSPALPAAVEPAAGKAAGERSLEQILLSYFDDDET